MAVGVGVQDIVQGPARGFWRAGAEGIEGAGGGGEAGETGGGAGRGGG